MSVDLFFSIFPFGAIIELTTAYYKKIMRWEGEIMRHPHRKSIFIRYLWILPFVIIGVSFLFFRPYVADLTVEGLLEFTPSDPVLASVVLLLLFALKSMTVVFPLMVLYLAVGHLFPLWWSLPLNLCGIVVCVTIPYLIGRYAQADALANVMQKYPKVEAFIIQHRSRGLFLSYFLRIITMVPGDLMSMLLGALRISYPYFLLGSTLGMAPSMIAATLAGDSITNPASPQFILSAVSIVVLAVLSAILYRRSNMS